MKRSLHLISIVTLVSLILSACNLPAGIPVTGVTETAEPPVNTNTATEPPATLVPINLAGPPMEVGSKYPYVDGTILVAVPGGTFIMGYQGEDNPVHEVTVSDFWIYSTKVTNSQYGLCVATGKCAPPDEKNNPLFGNSSRANYPVTGVNYEQALQYCSFVHGKLPTEAQWEKAARGPEGNIFPWGDAAPSCDLSNFLSCVGNLTPINEYADGVSFYSAFDMAGNTREWALDWYSPSYYTQSPAQDPLGPELGEKRSVRGSSFQDGTDSSLAAHRFSLRPTENLSDLGFRCVVGDPTYFAPMCQQLAYIGIGPNGEGTECTPDVKCNDVSVSQAPVCTQRLQPYTIVTFGLTETPPDDWTYDVPGCTQISSDAKYVCDPPGPYVASVAGSCTGTNTCETTCPDHYTKDGDLCKWDGSGAIGKECMPGSTYDPLTQCCSATPGSAVDFNFCPAGYAPLDGACIADPSFSQDKDALDVLFNSCEPPKQTGGGGGPGTGLTPAACTLTCGSCEILDPVKCACVSDPRC